MDDASVAQIVSFTNATPEQAQRLLHLTDGNTEQAIDLFFNSDGLDLGANSTTTTSHTTQVIRPSSPSPVPASRHYYEEDEDGVVHVDSDDDESPPPAPLNTAPQRSRQQARPSTQTRSSDQSASTFESDEAIARRLQEEFYGSTGSGSGARDPDGIRAPIASTRETLVGPGSYDEVDEDEMRTAMLEQLRARRARPRGENNRPEVIVYIFANLRRPTGHIQPAIRSRRMGSPQLGPQLEPTPSRALPCNWWSIRNQPKVQHSCRNVSTSIRPHVTTDLGRSSR